MRASIERQTYRELEVILIDDGSTDDTPALLDRLAVQDSRVRVTREIAIFATSGAVVVCAGRTSAGVRMPEAAIT